MTQNKKDICELLRLSKLKCEALADCIEVQVIFLQNAEWYALVGVRRLLV